MAALGFSRSEAAGLGEAVVAALGFSRSEGSTLAEAVEFIRGGPR